MPAAGLGTSLGESVPARTTRHQRTTLTELRSDPEDPRPGCTRQAGKGMTGATHTVTKDSSPGPPVARRHPRALRLAALTNSPEGRGRRGAVTYVSAGRGGRRGADVGPAGGSGLTRSCDVHPQGRQWWHLMLRRPLAGLAAAALGRAPSDGEWRPVPQRAKRLGARRSRRAVRRTAATPRV